MNSAILPTPDLTRLELCRNLAKVRRLQIPIRGTLEFGQYVLGGLRDHPLWQLERTLIARCFGPAAPDKPKEAKEPWPSHAVATFIEDDLKSVTDDYRRAVARENWDREMGEIIDGSSE